MEYSVFIDCEASFIGRLIFTFMYSELNINLSSPRHRPEAHPVKTTSSRKDDVINSQPVSHHCILRENYFTRNVFL